MVCQRCGASAADPADRAISALPGQVRPGRDGPACGGTDNWAHRVPSFVRRVLSSSLFPKMSRTGFLAPVWLSVPYAPLGSPRAVGRVAGSGARGGLLPDLDLPGRSSPTPATQLRPASPSLERRGVLARTSLTLPWPRPPSRGFWAVCGTDQAGTMASIHVSEAGAAVSYFHRGFNNLVSDVTSWF